MLIILVCNFAYIFYLDLLRYSFPKDIYDIRSLFEGGAGFVLDQINIKKDIIKNKITSLKSKNNTEINKNQDNKIENVNNNLNKPLEFKIENSNYEGNDEIEIKIDNN